MNQPNPLLREIGKLRARADWQNSCGRVDPNAPVHLAFQLRVFQSGFQNARGVDVLDFLARPHCVYDDWRDVVGSGSNQPTIQQPKILGGCK